MKSSYRGKNSKGSVVGVIVVALVMLLAVGGLGYLTGGYVQWDWTASAWETFTGWFTPAPVEEESEFLYEFEDFEAVENENNVIYIMNIDSAFEDCAEGDYVVVEVTYYFDGEEVDTLSYELPYDYNSDVEMVSFMPEEVDGIPIVQIFNNAEFDFENGMESDFPFLAAEGSLVIVVAFFDVEDYDSFDIVSIEYVLAEDVMD